MNTDGITIIPNGLLDFSDLLTQLRMSINGGIISLLKDDMNELLMAGLYKLNMKPEEYPVINFFFNENRLPKNPEAFNKHYFVEYGNVPNKDEAEVSDALPDYIKYFDHVTSKIFYITKYLITYLNTQNQYNETAMDIYFSTPNADRIYLLQDNTFTGWIKIFKSDNSALVPVLDDKMMYIPRVFDTNLEEGYFLCQIDNTGVTTELKKTMMNYITFGVLISLTGSLRQLDFNLFLPLYAYITSDNSRNGINNYFLKLKYLDSQSLISQAEINAKKFISDPKIATVIGVFHEDIRYIISPLFKNTTKLFWYLGINEGENCHSNTIYTGRSLSQYLAIIQRTVPNLVGKGKLYLLGNLESQSQIIYSEAIRSAFSRSVISIELLFYNLTETTLYDYSDYIIKNTVVGSVLLDLTSFEDSKSINSFFSKYTIPDDVLKVFLLKCPTYSYEESEIVYENVYCLTGTLDSQDASKIHQTIYQFTGSRDYNEFMENTVIAYNIFKCAFSSSGSAMFDDLIKYIYTCKTDSTSGEIAIQNNNYNQKRSFVLHNTERLKWESFAVQLDAIVPKAYNWDLEESFGYVCSFTDPEIGEKAKKDLITIETIFSETGVYKSLDKSLSLIVQNLAEQLNKDDGLLKRTVYFESWDLQSDENKCIEIFPKATNRANVIFTTASSTCIKIISYLLIEKNIVLFSLGLADDISCSSNIIFAGRHRSLLNNVLDRLVLSEPEYSFIGYDNPITYINFQYIQQYLERFKAVINNVFELDLNIDPENVMSLLKAKMKSGIIFITGPIEFLELFNSVFEKNKNEFKYIHIQLGEGDFKESTFNFDIYTIGGYYQSINNEANTIMIDSLRAFLTETDPISEPMYLSYTTFQIWVNAVKETQSIESKKLIGNILSSSYQSAEGLIHSTPSGLLFRTIYYSKYSDNKIDELYKSRNPVKPYLFSPYVSFQYEECYIEQGEKRIEMTTNVIAILGNIKHSTDLVNNDFLFILKYLVDDTNNDDGLLGFYFVLQIFETDDTVESYLSQVTRISDRSDISITFTACSDKIIHEISRVFVEKNKLIIHCGFTATEICDNGVFYFGPQVSLFSEAFIPTFINNYPSVIIVEDDERPSIVLRKQISFFTLRNSNTIIDTIKIYNSTLKNVLKNASDSTLIILCIDPITIQRYVEVLCDYKNILFFSPPESIFHSFPKCFPNANILTPFSNQLMRDKTDFVEDNQIYLNIINRFGSDFFPSPFANGAMEGYYSYKRAVSFSNSFDVDSVRHSLFGLTISTPSGQLVIENSFFIRHRVFHGVLKNGKVVIDSGTDLPYVPVVFMPELNDEKYYICTFNDAKENGKIEKKLIKIGVVFNMQDFDEEVVLYSTLIVMKTSQQINNRGGILGNFIYPVFMISRDFDALRATMRQFILDESVRAIIGCIGTECRDIFTEESDQSTLLLTPSVIFDQFCDSNVIVLSCTQIQMPEPAIMYTTSIGINTYVVIKDDSIEYIVINNSRNKNLDQYLNVEIEKTKGKILKSYDIVDDAAKISDMLVDIKTLISNNVKRIVAICLPSRRLRLSIISEAENHIEFRNGIIRFLFFSNNRDIPADMTKISGALLISGFSENVNTPEVLAFVKKMKESYGAESINYSFESITYLLKLWEDAVLSAQLQSGSSDWPDFNYIKAAFQNTEVILPTGRVFIQESNFAKRSVYVLEADESGRWRQVYPKLGETAKNVVTNPYPTEEYTSKCRFGKTVSKVQSQLYVPISHYIIFCLSVIEILFSAFWILKHRVHTIVEIAGFPMTIAILLGCLLILVATCFFVMQPETIKTCNSRLVDLSLGWVFVTSGLFGKLYKASSFKVNSKVKIKLLKIEIFQSYSNILHHFHCTITICYNLFIGLVNKKPIEVRANNKN